MSMDKRIERIIALAREHGFRNPTDGPFPVGIGTLGFWIDTYVDYDYEQALLILTQTKEGVCRFMTLVLSPHGEKAELIGPLMQGWPDRKERRTARTHFVSTIDAMLDGVRMSTHLQRYAPFVPVTEESLN